MNPLALLCNLHAEGPTTLRKLRSAGLADLEDLAAFPEEELAAALDCDIVQARRFVCEGRLLGERFGFDVSEAPEPRRDAFRGSSLPAKAAGRLAPPWHEAADTARPPSAPVASAHDAGAAAEKRAALRAGNPAALRASDPAVLRAGDPAALRVGDPTALRAGEIDGLDDGWCAALVGQGVLTLEALADAPALALARALGRPLTQLVELQCLARRRLLAANPNTVVTMAPLPEAPSEERADEPPMRQVTLHPRAAPFPADPGGPGRTGGARHERPVVPTESPGSGGPFS